LSLVGLAADPPLLDPVFRGQGSLFNELDHGSLDMVRKAIAEDNGETMFRSDNIGRYPLHLALRKAVMQASDIRRYPLLEVVEALIAAGANMEARDADGRSALYLSVVLGRGEATRALLRAGAAVQTTDGTGKTLLQFVADKATKKQPAEGLLDAVQALVDAGADLRSVSEKAAVTIESRLQKLQAKKARREEEGSKVEGLVGFLAELEMPERIVLAVKFCTSLGISALEELHGHEAALADHLALSGTLRKNFVRLLKKRAEPGKDEV